MAEDVVRDHIFIYSGGASGRLYDWLRIAFGRDRVDWGHIEPARTAVCVAVIGPRWASAENLRRLHHRADRGRHDLVRALATTHLTIFPTLVEGAVVPNATDLPAEVGPLFDDWKVRRVTEEGWEDDVRRLIAEIGNAAHLVVPPDLDTLLRDAGAAQRRVAEFEQTRSLQGNRIPALRQTLDVLRYKLASPGKRAQLAEAFAALARGNSLPAEQVFERDVEMQSRPARGTKAEAARHAANLALMHDVARAVSFYRRALQVAPAHIQTACRLGEALMLVGNLSDAKAAFAHALTVAEAEDSHLQIEAYVRLGDVQRLSGAAGSARAAYKTAMTIAEQGVARDPTNTICRYDLKVIHDRIAELPQAEGDGSEAVAACRRSLAAAEARVARDSANPEWQYELLLSHDRTGDVLMLQRNFLDALAAYSRGLELREALVARDPDRTEWERNLVVSHARIAGVLLAQGDAPGALAAYRRSLAVREALVARDPANPEWQRDLAVSHDTMGDVLVVHGDFPGALAAYRRSLAVVDTLAARDDHDHDFQWHKGLLIKIDSHTIRADRRSF